METLKYRHNSDNNSWTYNFDFRLNFTQFSTGQNLYMRTDLFAGSRFTGSQFDITGDKFIASWKKEKKLGMNKWKYGNKSNMVFF